jgi:hypothetical protein
VQVVSLFTDSRMGVQDVFLCTTSSVGRAGCILSFVTVSRVDVQDVSLSNTNSMICNVYPFSPPAVWTRCIPFRRVKCKVDCGRAKCIPYHHQQHERGGCIPFHRTAIEHQCGTCRVYPWLSTFVQFLDSGTPDCPRHLIIPVPK